MDLKKQLYHPYELAFSGLSGSGKSTLLCKLLNHFKENYNVFYAKHDAHFFEMDHAGKDTYNARSSGAKAISIGNENSWATIQDRPMSMIDQKLLALDYDFALIEGHKYSKAAKIVFTNDQFNLKNEILAGKITEIIAIIGDQNLALELNLPYFHRDESDKIAQFVLDYFLKIYRAMPINGMALIGGKSTRMGQDKSKLVYHDKIQAEHLLDVLGQHCEKVYYSGRSDQALDPSFSKYDFIKDQFLDFGPSSGILSYFKCYPNTRLLVCACDMPHIDEASVQYLIDSAHPFKLATTYENPDRLWPEPLFTIYNPKTYSRLLQLLATGYDCPMKMLFNSDIKKITPKNISAISNVNTPSEYHEIKGKSK